MSVENLSSGSTEQKYRVSSPIFKLTALAEIVGSAAKELRYSQQFIDARNSVKSQVDLLSMQEAAVPASALRVEMSSTIRVLLPTYIGRSLLGYHYVDLGGMT